MNLDAYYRYLNSRAPTSKPLAFEKPVSPIQDDVPIGRIIAVVTFAYFVVFLIDRLV